TAPRRPASPYRTARSTPCYSQSVSGESLDGRHDMLAHFGVRQRADEIDQVPDLVRRQVLALLEHPRAVDARMDAVVEVHRPAAAAVDRLGQVARPDQRAPLIELEQ